MQAWGRRGHVSSHAPDGRCLRSALIPSSLGRADRPSEVKGTLRPVKASACPGAALGQSVWATSTLCPPLLPSEQPGGLGLRRLAADAGSWLDSARPRSNTAWLFPPSDPRGRLPFMLRMGRMGQLGSAARAPQPPLCLLPAGSHQSRPAAEQAASEAASPCPWALGRGSLPSPSGSSGSNPLPEMPHQQPVLGPVWVSPGGFRCAPALSGAQCEMARA